MAIQWGAWDYGSNGSGFRIGVDVTNTAVSSGSASVTFTFRVYVQNQHNVDDMMSLVFSGTAGSHTSVTFDNQSGTDGYYALRATKTFTYTYSTYGTSPGTRTFTAQLSGAYNGANPLKAVTVTIPARPYTVPAPPSSVVATRNSDSQATITWVRNATTAAPYAGVVVQRATYSGTTWSSYITVGTASATATSMVNTGLSANRIYHYRVYATNAAGFSTVVYATPYVRMTPSAPLDVYSFVEPGGGAVTTDWDNTSYIDPDDQVTYKIQRSVNGGAYASVATEIPQGTDSWTDPTPGAGSNTYQVAAVQSAGTLSSAWVTGNAVTTIVPPLAPTVLNPNGVARDFALVQVFTWQHNHGGDGAAQSAYWIEYSTNGGGAWSDLTPGGVVSTSQSHTITAGTLANGADYLWRVRTRGVVSEGYGPNSAAATTTGRVTPVVAITGPPATVVSLPLTATWTYTQAQGSAQSAWEVQLVSSAGVIVEFDTGNGTGLSRLLDYRPTFGVFTLKVRARSVDSIWSNWATRELTITLAPPAHVSIEAEYQPSTGTTVLHLVPEAVGGGEVAIEDVVVERRVPGGEWGTLLTGLEVPNDFVDLLPATKGTTQYRVTVTSATPTYRTEPVVEVTPYPADTPGAQPDIQWIFLNYGEGFANVLRTRSNPKVSHATSREKGHQRFLGRRKRVGAFGVGRTREVAVQADLVFDAASRGDDYFLWDSPPDEWEEAGLEAEVVCYRDYTGKRIFGLLSGVDTSPLSPGHAGLTFAVSETDYSELEGIPMVLPDDLESLDGGLPWYVDPDDIDGGTA